MAIASKPTPGLNVFAFRYVNSQCQHDSLSLKLAAKLHLFTETAKFLTDYFNSRFTYILRIYFFQTGDYLLRRKGKAIDRSLFAFIVKKSLVYSSRLSCPHQFNGLFAGQVLNVEAEQQDVVQRFVNLMLQAGLVTWRVSASQEAQGLHLLVGVLQDVDAAESDHAPEVGRELGRLDFILINDAKRATTVSLDGINLVSLHCRMEDDRPVGIDVAERHGIRVTTVARQRKHARSATAEDKLTFFSG